MSARETSSGRLGNDPFAALGVSPTDRNQTSVSRKKRGPKSPPAAKTQRTATTKSRKKPAPPEGDSGALSALPVSHDGAEWDFDALDARIEQAISLLHQLPLPEGPPPRSTMDQFADLVRDTFRAISPLTYLRQLNRVLYAGRSFHVDPFGLDPEFEERADRIADFFYRYWWRVDALGVDNIPGGGRTLIVSNHSGMLPYDGAMIKHAVRVHHPARRTVRFLVENFAFYFPILGTLIYRYGGVRASMDNATRLLNDDQLTAVFPEGVKGLGKLYRQRYQLQRFGRGGFIKLALRTRSPIVPVAVIGAEEIHPILAHADFLKKPLRVPYVPITPTFPWLGPLGLVPLPTKWTIVFGEPLTLPLEYGPEEADNELLVSELTLCTPSHP
ncbi:MAG: acyltransferase family protein [Candidatus Dadabacteria bacterium]|nr:MAG: acyltransferase family protein [Candidatus Dadabacteria bacterium]